MILFCANIPGGVERHQAAPSLWETALTSGCGVRIEVGIPGGEWSRDGDALAAGEILAAADERQGGVGPWRWPAGAGGRASGSCRAQEGR
jgi:hypothetical protein